MEFVVALKQDSEVAVPWRMPRRLRRRRMVGNSFPGFQLERQLQTNWCWAAVSQGIAKHLEGRSGVVSQLQMAFEILGDPAVLINPEAFNWPRSIALHWQRRRRLFLFRNDALSEADVRDAVGPQAVVIATIEWKKDDNHFVVVSGWFKPETECKLIVHDPGVPGTRAYWAYSALCHAYRRPKGRWFQSSLLRKR